MKENENRPFGTRFLELGEQGCVMQLHSRAPQLPKLRGDSLGREIEELDTWSGGFYYCHLPIIDLKPFSPQVRG